MADTRRKYNHSGINSGSYGDIEYNAVFEISGLGNVVINGSIGQYAHIKKSGVGRLIIIGDVQEKAQIEISGTGDVILNGKIRKGSIIYKSGTGKLMVNGSMDDDVKFTVSGTGDVDFSQRPPESVVRLIDKSGIGAINMPGGYRAQLMPDSGIELIDSLQSLVRQIGSGLVVSTNRSHTSTRISGNGSASIGSRSISSNNGVITINQNGVTTKYRGQSISTINGNIIIDGRAVTPNDDRIIHADNDVSSVFYSPAPQRFVLPAAVDNRQQFAPQVQQNNVVKVDEMAGYSAHLKEYIKGMQQKALTLSMQIEALKLNAEEEALFDKYKDSITFAYVDVPVLLNEKLYDWSTIQQLSKKPLDPFTKEPFQLSEVSSARTIVQEIEVLIEQVINKRNVVQAQPVQQGQLNNANITDEFKGYESDLVEYIKKMRAKPKSLSARVKALGLKFDEEEKLFSEFQDSQTNEFVNVPVRLDEELYDWDTIVSFEGINPYTTKPFMPQDVVKAPKLAAKFEDVILAEERKLAAKAEEKKSEEKEEEKQPEVSVAKQGMFQGGSEQARLVSAMAASASAVASAVTDAFQNPTK